MSIYEINPNQLDREWVEQPKLYHEAALELADARRDLEEAKRERDVVRAEVALDIRTNPKKYGLEKVTEATIAAAVPTTSAVKMSEANVIDFKHAVDIHSASVDALEHKKRALEKLVALRLADYFAEPVEPKGAEGLAAEETKRRVRKGTKKTRRRRKEEDDD